MPFDFSDHSLDSGVYSGERRSGKRKMVAYFGDPWYTDLTERIVMRRRDFCDFL